jgi:ABC-type Mn2+/Zn2+ transport system permease subunit
MGQQVELALTESMHSVIVKLVSFLPGLLALVVAVGLLTGLGALLAFVLRRGLTAAKFDERFARSQSVNVADWAPAHSPTVLIARVIFWAFVLLGFIIGSSPPSSSPTSPTQSAPSLF